MLYSLIPDDNDDIGDDSGDDDDDDDYDYVMMMNIMMMKITMIVVLGGHTLVDASCRKKHLLSTFFTADRGSRRGGNKSATSWPAKRPRFPCAVLPWHLRSRWST